RFANRVNVGSFPHEWDGECPGVLLVRLGVTGEVMRPLTDEKTIRVFLVVVVPGYGSTDLRSGIWRGRCMIGRPQDYNVPTVYLAPHASPDNQVILGHQGVRRDCQAIRVTIQTDLERP